MSFDTVEMQRVGGLRLRPGKPWQEAVAELALAARSEGATFTFMAGNIPIHVDAESRAELLEHDVQLAKRGYLEGVGPAPQQFTKKQRKLIKELLALDTRRAKLVYRLRRLMIIEPQ